jgi:MinD superfamily P-loop ATPase
MRIVISSGKGGTGKTTVALSLAHIWKSPLTLIDLDVEAPNVELFLKPEIEGRQSASLMVPQIDLNRCDRCGACVDLCQFKAISRFGDIMMQTPELCHGCGGCLAICAQKAITPGQRQLGEVIWGHRETCTFLAGRLRIGEAMSPPLMRAVLNKFEQLEINPLQDTIIDAPPGTSCPAVTAVLDSDLIVLVTEPTPFGFHDLQMAYEAFRNLGPRLGVVINRSGTGFDETDAFCRHENIPILAEIPHEQAIAQAYARGRIIASLGPLMEKRFRHLKTQIIGLCQHPPSPEAVFHG